MTKVVAAVFFLTGVLFTVFYFTDNDFGTLTTGRLIRLIRVGRLMGSRQQ